MERFDIKPQYLRTLDGIMVNGVLREVGTKEEVDGYVNVRLTDGETVSFPADGPVTIAGNYEVEAHELFRDEAADAEAEPVNSKAKAA